MKMKIGTKLMAAGAAIVIIPFVAMGIIVSLRVTSGITALIGEDLTDLTTSVADFADSKIKADLRACVALASSPDIAETVDQINRGTPGAMKTAADLGARLAGLYGQNGYSSNYSEIFVVAANGKVCAAAVQSSFGVDVSEREYFKKAMGGEAFVSQMLIDKVSKDKTYIASAPVLGRDGKPAGVCCVTAKTSVITDEMNKFVLGKTGYIWAVDRDGLVVLHPDQKIVLSENIANLDGMGKVAARALGNESGIEAYVYKGVRKVCAFSPISSNGWKVISTMTESEFLSTALAIRDLILIIAAAAVALALACLYFLSRSLSVPIGRAAQYAEGIAKGDLAKDVHPSFLARGDEIGGLAHAFKDQKDKLHEVAREISISASNVSQGSADISSTAQSMSQGSTEQAASAEEVSSSVEEMAATIKQNADNATTTEAIASKAAKDAESGSAVVDKAVEAMKQIADKVGIISEIARQTNMLALNAAIEAARAGESGKGFAVVASEVRKLAERSQTAAGEITELSANTVGLAQDAGKIISDIVPDIQKTADLVREIAAASREQSVGVEQIGKAMMQLDSVIQSNASASEEMASMAEEFSAQAQQLAATVSFFKLEEGQGGERAGAGSAAGKPPRAALSQAHGEAGKKAGTASRAIRPAAPKGDDGEFESF
jgi:methyl-accepting chemotaxis protein